MSEVNENNVIRTTVFGIDLGTTYSCISYLKDGHPVVCQSVEGQNTTPSVVRITEPDNLSMENGWVAGRTAKETAIIYPADTFQFIKAQIGRVDTVDYGSEDDRHSISPVEVSAYILRKLKNDAETATGMVVEDVVITCPAYFSAAEKDATKKAGEMAGLNVWNIIEEPTAAAVYYGMEHYNEKETICVFDLGGGTFDVTAMTIDNGVLKVETTEGNHDLGGKNWDAALVEYVKDKFIEETNYTDEFDEDTQQELIIKCEQAKIQLTGTDKASVALKVDRKHSANIEITRDDFDDLTGSLLSSAIELTKKVFEIMQERGNPITKILLVGGSSYMPQVRKAVEKEFGVDILMNEPNEAVSKGACLYCAMFPPVPTEPSDEGGDSSNGVNGDVEEGPIISITGDTVTVKSTDGPDKIIDIALSGAKIKIITCASKSFGIQVVVTEANGSKRDAVYNLVKKDQVLPFSITKDFSLEQANTTNLDIKVFQNDDRDNISELDSCIMIGNGLLEGIPEGLPAGTPVNISFNIDESGMIEISGDYNGDPLIGSVSFTYEEGLTKSNG